MSQSLYPSSYRIQHRRWQLSLYSMALFTCLPLASRLQYYPDLVNTSIAKGVGNLTESEQLRQNQVLQNQFEEYIHSLDIPREARESSVSLEHYRNVTLEFNQFDYSKPVQPTSDTLKVPRMRDTDYGMITLVLSTRVNFERRRAIRETWGKNHSVYFVVGGPPRAPLLMSESDDIQQQLRAEQEEYEDLLDCLHPDSYQSLPYKLKFAYNWTVTNIPSAQWLVKVDDDTVVRVDTLSKMFLRNYNSRIPMVIGEIVDNSPVARHGKWVDHLYQNDVYPYWPKGSCGHVVSRVVAEYVGESPDLIYYQGEDVSLGIWLDESPLHVSWINSRYFSNTGTCSGHEWLIMGHGISVERMYKCYERKDEWLPLDAMDENRRYWNIESLQQRKGMF